MVYLPIFDFSRDIYLQNKCILGGIVMKKYKVAVTKYGFAIVDAESPQKALEITENLNDSDFDWSEFQNPEVMEEIEKGCCSPSYRHLSKEQYKSLRKGDEVLVSLHGQIASVTIEDFIPFSDHFTAKFTDEVFGPDDVFEECEEGYDPEYQLEER